MFRTRFCRCSILTEQSGTGPSETAGESEFDTVDRHWRIYRKRRDARLTSVSRFPMTSLNTLAGVAPHNQHLPTEAIDIPRSPQSETIRLLKTYDALLDMYMPAGFLVDLHGNIIHVFGDVARILGRCSDGQQWICWTSWSMSCVLPQEPGSSAPRRSARSCLMAVFA